MGLQPELESAMQNSAPKVFALVGTPKSPDEPAYVGYGLEFREPAQAVLCIEGDTWTGDSAEALRDLHQVIADARIVWLPLESTG
ncbi:hypothetical protein [Actinosynnema sp. NPDC020468]|uniref:hypothetical protein n=1 Tax=Actinosynnema sp. NPDC020468 TaxID=3154488 RepID=UPI0033EA695F